MYKKARSVLREELPLFVQQFLMVRLYSAWEPGLDVDHNPPHAQHSGPSTALSVSSHL